MNAHEIVKLLALKHNKDVFVPECKDGPTHYANHLRMDAWAMKRSWANPKLTGYEIKVSRADFLKDDKWPGYLCNCNEFYFVAPPKIIDPLELPKEAGLLVVTSTGNGFTTKKRAPFRQIESPNMIYEYVLMCRAKISRVYESDEQTIDYWRNWLAEKKESRQIGYKVSKRIREYVHEVEAENERLKRDAERVEETRQMLVQLGIRPDDYRNIKERRAKELAAGIPEDFVEDVSTAIRKLQSIISTVDKIQKAAT
ncbi:MAG: hypothetical protein AMXMBFR84_37610 [Candidatus Hydrogenedentota bacterium]